MLEIEATKLLAPFLFTATLYEKYEGINGWPSNNVFIKSSFVWFLKAQLFCLSSPKVLLFLSLIPLPQREPAPCAGNILALSGKSLNFSEIV